MRALRLFRAFVAMLSLGLLASCASFESTRAEKPKPCPPVSKLDSGYRELCQDVSVDKTNPKFAIGYVEFTDQGWLHRRAQLKASLDLLAEKPDQPLQIVLFIHGWKHSADKEDQNVKAFREKILPEFVAKNDGDTRTVGIYVGWRGRSIGIPGIVQNLSFYDRKSTAEYVARGSVRELLAHLRVMREENSGPGKRKVTITLIGHSFGGLILFNAMADSHLDNIVTSARQQPNNAKTPDRSATGVADLVVLVNAAFEATRYEPLFQAARYGLNGNALSADYAANQRPLLLQITSIADLATKNAFPIGRFINTVLEHEAITDQDPDGTPHEDRLEKKTNTNTVGHVDRYLTHHLTAAPAVVKDGKTEPLRINCAKRLTTEGIDLPKNFPLWSMKTDGNVMNGHNDIFKAELWELVVKIRDDKLSGGAKSVC
jgi:pimeloyl-ACP methyl ester carboxylesterase